MTPDEWKIWEPEFGNQAEHEKSERKKDINNAIAEGLTILGVLVALSTLSTLTGRLVLSLFNL